MCCTPVFAFRRHNATYAYDCRRRVWYTEAITSPKDVVILLDLSGSMTGKHFAIAKLITRALIDTFQQNDFFNVVLFNDNVRLIIPCIEILLQATTRNKAAVIDMVDDLPEPAGQSRSAAGFAKTFDVLNKSSGNNSTSSACTQMIILVSDGIENSVEVDQVLAIDNVNKRVVIFSYIIGQSNQHAMKKIACGNGGEFYEFPTLGIYLVTIKKPFLLFMNCGPFR